MEKQDEEKLRQIKDMANELRYKFETLARGAISIGEICWDTLAQDRTFNDTQRQLLDNLDFELRNMAQYGEGAGTILDAVIEAASRFDKELQ